MAKVSNGYKQMGIGEVKVADDQDFFYLKYLVEGEPGWTLEFDKDNTKVWTKPVSTTNFKMVKVNAVFREVDPEVLYDVLHDPEYRKVWDSHMIEQYDIGALNPNNDLGYYAMTCPSPVSKRDFVLQRSWLDTGQEKYIINHSVYHKSCPPRKDFVRAKSFITGDGDWEEKMASFLFNLPRPLFLVGDPAVFMISQFPFPTPNFIPAYLLLGNELLDDEFKFGPRNSFLVRSGRTAGSVLDYVSQSDPCGKLPSVLVNKLTQKVARKMVATLEVACKGYPAWKISHNPAWKPWHNPEQMTKPRVLLDDCKPSTSDLALLQGKTETALATTSQKSKKK